MEGVVLDLITLDKMKYLSLLLLMKVFTFLKIFKEKINIIYEKFFKIPTFMEKEFKDFSPNKVQAYNYLETKK